MQAPEILQGRKYDAKSDLWSVGAILFEMLAGKPPFGGANQVYLSRRLGTHAGCEIHVIMVTHIMRTSELHVL